MNLLFGLLVIVFCWAQSAEDTTGEVVCDGYQPVGDKTTITTLTLKKNCYFIVNETTTISIVKIAEGEFGGKIFVKEGTLTIETFVSGYIVSESSLEITKADGEGMRKLYSKKGSVTLKGASHFNYLLIDKDVTFTLKEDVNSFTRFVVDTFIDNTEFTIPGNWQVEIETLGTDSETTLKLISSKYQISVNRFENDVLYKQNEMIVYFSTQTLDLSGPQILFSCGADALREEYPEGSHPLCPCYSLSFDCEVMIDKSGEINLGENPLIKTMTITSDVIITGSGNLVVETVNLNAQRLTINGFTSATIEKQTGEGPLELNTPTTLVSAESSNIEITNGLLVLNSQTSNPVTLTISPTGSANILSDNKLTINTVGSVTFSGKEFNSVVTFSGEQTTTKVLDISNVDIKDQSAITLVENVEIHCKSYRDVISRIQNSESLKINVEGTVISLGDKTEKSCNYFDNFDTDYYVCTDYYSQGMEIAQIGSDIKDKKFVFGNDQVEITADVSFGSVDFSEKKIVIIQSPEGEKKTLTITKEENFQNKFSETISFANTKVVFKKGTNEQINGKSIVLIDSEVIFEDKEVTFKTIEMDDNSHIYFPNDNAKGQNKLVCDNIEFNFVNGTTADEEDDDERYVPLIENIENDNFIVNNYIDYSIDEKIKTNGFIVVIVRSGASRPYAGSIPEKFHLACTKRALIFINQMEVDSFRCSDVNIAEKRCKIVSSAIEPNGDTLSIDLGAKDTYESNNDYGCPCRSDISGSGDKCIVEFVSGSDSVFSTEENKEKTVVFTSTKGEQSFGEMHLPFTNKVEFNLSRFTCEDFVLQGDAVFTCEDGIRFRNFTIDTEQETVKLTLNGKTTFQENIIFEDETKTLEIFMGDDMFIEASLEQFDSKKILHVDTNILTIRTEGLKLDELHVKKVSQNELSRINIGEGYKLAIAQNGVINYENSVSQQDSEDYHAVIMNLNRYEQIELPETYTVKNHGAFCSPLIEFASTADSGSEHYKSLETDYSVVGCNSKTLILCGKKPDDLTAEESGRYPYICRGDMECSFFDNHEGVEEYVLDANKSSSYKDKPVDCPCSMGESPMFSADCKTIFPPDVKDYKIINFGGNFDEIVINTDVSIELYQSVISDEIKAKGKINFLLSKNAEESVVISSPFLNIYASQQTKLSFDVESKFTKFYTRSSSDLEFKKKNELYLSDVTQGAHLSLHYDSQEFEFTGEETYETLMNDARWSILHLDGYNFSDVSMSFNTKYPLRIIGDYDVKETTLIRATTKPQGTVNDANMTKVYDILDSQLPVFIFDNKQRTFTTTAFSVVQYNVLQYYVVILADVYMVNVPFEEQGKVNSYLMADEFRSMLYYKVNQPSRDQIECTFVEGKETSTKYNFAINNLKGEWDREQCPCMGEFCTLTINRGENAPQTHVMESLNVTNLDQMIVNSGEVYFKEGNITAETVTFKKPLTKLTIDNVKGSIRSLNFDSVTNAKFTIQNIEGTPMKISKIQWNSAENSAKPITFSSMRLNDIQLTNYEYSFDDQVNINRLVLNKGQGKMNQFKLTQTATTGQSTLGKTQIKKSQLYFTYGKWKYDSKEIDVEIEKGEQFPIVFAGSSSVTFNNVTVNVYIPTKIDGPIYIFRISQKNFISDHSISFNVVSKELTIEDADPEPVTPPEDKPEPVEPSETSEQSEQSVASNDGSEQVVPSRKRRELKRDTGGYEMKEVCGIYVALLPKDYKVEKCPPDPCGTNEASLQEPTQEEEEVPIWLIVVLVVVVVLIVLVLVLFIVFIVVAKKILLRKKNLKVFDDDDNIFYQSEATSVDEQSDDDDETSESSGSGSGTGSGSSSDNESGAAAGSTSESGSGSGSGSESETSSGSGSGSVSESGSGSGSVSSSSEEESGKGSASSTESSGSPVASVSSDDSDSD